MSWPLTGSPLAKYNRLLSDLRQYGTFYFIGSPDDITFLWEIIRSASDGVLSPELDDVANRPVFWMLTLATFLGDQIVAPAPSTPCPECPPVVPCPPLTGLNWESDETTILAFTSDSTPTAGFPYNDPSITSITFHSLQDIVGNVSLNGSTGLTRFFAPLLETIGGDAEFSGAALLTEIDFPFLVSVGTLFAASFMNNLVRVALPELVSVGGPFEVLVNPALTELSVPKLETSGGMNAQDNPLLTEVFFPVWLPPNGTTVEFQNGGLNVASVNHILARCVANPAFVTGIVDLSGGTNAAPTGQGIADVATLIGRGVTVTTN